MRPNCNFFAMLWAMAGVMGFAAAALGGNWPQFRGPSGQGLTDESNLPLTWSGQKNLVWKTPLPAKISNPYSSPIVWGDRIFVTVARDDQPRDQHVLCYSVSDGKQLWDTPIAEGPWKTGRDNGYPTPTTDGTHVYAVFGSAVVACLDFDGHVIWSRPLQRFDFDVAMGSSPVLYGDTVILLCDQNNRHSSLIGFDKRTGEIKWEQMRPEMAFAHSTPLLAKVGGRDELILSVSKAVQGVDPENGKLIWWCNSDGDTSSPVYAAGLVYADGGRGGPGICLDASGSGDISKTAIKWKISAMDSLGSPIVVDGLLYRFLNPDVLRVYRMSDGQKVYSSRLEGATTWASPIATPRGRIYFATSGKSYVIAAGPEFRLLASNDLGDPNNASPAVSDGKLILKGQKFLWCIGNK